MKEAVNSKYWFTPTDARATNSCDIGRAIIKNEGTYKITWGRRLSWADAKWFRDKTEFVPIKIQPGVYELILRRIYDA